MGIESVIGSPGTGKTHHIEMDILENGSEYTYITYNRSMAAQARERLNSKKDATGTLHSIIAQELGLHDFLAPKDLAEFARLYGLDYRIFNYDEWRHETGLERFLRYYSYNINTMQKPRAVVGERLDIPYLTDQYNRYKERKEKLDYDDVLAEGYKYTGFSTDVLYVDEAQDFTAIMWKITDRWNASRKVIVGDDDQAIYRFMGADIDGYRAHIHAPKVLEKSYRISDRVRELADSVLGPARKIPKHYHGVGATALKNYNWQDFLKLQGSKAILCRTNFMAQKLSKLEDAIVKPINVEHKFSNGWTDRTLRLMDIIGKMPNITAEEYQYLVKYTPAGMWVRGTKAKILKTPQLFTYDKLKSALRKIDIIERLLIHDEEKRKIIKWMGRDLPPVVYVDTMHSTKGLEFDNVIVAVDRPASIEIDDDERRLLYVALTRARKSLGFKHYKIYPGAYGMLKSYTR